MIGSFSEDFVSNPPHDTRLMIFFVPDSSLAGKPELQSRLRR